MKRDDLGLIRKVILDKVKRATVPQNWLRFSDIVNHAQQWKGQYVYYRVDYEALFGFWFDPEEASRLKMIRFTDGSIIEANEVYLHDLIPEAHYRAVNKTLLLRTLMGDNEPPTVKETLQ